MTNKYVLEFDLTPTWKLEKNFENLVLDEKVEKKKRCNDTSIPEKNPDEKYLEEISSEYAEKARNNQITDDDIKQMPFQDLMILANIERFRKRIFDITGTRGVPFKPGIKLYPHQIQALLWMRARENLDPLRVFGLVGGIICLDMGLGKTLLSLCLTLSSKKGDFPTLVVCSKTVMLEWKKSGVSKFFDDSVKALYLHKDFIKDPNIVDRKTILQYDIVITTYDTCMSACRKHPEFCERCLERGDEHTLMKDKIVAIHCAGRKQADNPKLKGYAVLYGTPWKRIFCDESQRFANPKTQTYKCIMALYGEKKWNLTGTPVRNYDTDIWAQLRFCGYNGVETALQWKMTGDDIFVLHNLKESIFCMGYSEAKIEMPDKFEHHVDIVMGGKHREVYQVILKMALDIVDQYLSKLVDYSCVLAMFTKLRQCCAAPFLLSPKSKRIKDRKRIKIKEKSSKKGRKIDELDDGTNDDEQEQDEKLDKSVSSKLLSEWIHDKTTQSGIYSAKIDKVIELIEEIIPEKEKILIFSTFSTCLDLLGDSFRERLPNLAFAQIDGAVTGEDRDTILTAFNSDPDIRVLLLTYKVGSEGLNLTVANNIIRMEPWWSPAVHKQANHRCWRIGQNAAVNIYSLIIRNTIEEQIIQICMEKENLEKFYLQGSKKEKRSAKLNFETLCKILGVFD